MEWIKPGQRAKLKVDFSPCKISAHWQSKRSYIPTIKTDHWNNYDRILSSPAAHARKTQSIKKSGGELWSAFPSWNARIKRKTASPRRLKTENTLMSSPNTSIKMTQISTRLHNGTGENSLHILGRAAKLQNLRICVIRFTTWTSVLLITVAVYHSAIKSTLNCSWCCDAGGVGALGL